MGEVPENLKSAVEQAQAVMGKSNQASNKPTNQPVTREELISFVVRNDQVEASEMRFSNDDRYQPPRSNNPNLIEAVAKELVNNPAYQEAKEKYDTAEKEREENPDSNSYRDWAGDAGIKLEGIVQGYSAAKGIPQSEFNLVTRALNGSENMMGISREDLNKREEILERMNKFNNPAFKFLEDGKSNTEIPAVKADQPAKTGERAPGE